MACASIAAGSRRTDPSNPARDSRIDPIRFSVIRSYQAVYQVLMVSWEVLVPKRAVHRVRLLMLLTLLAQFLHAAPAMVAQEGGEPEAGAVVGTTGLNIRECPDVTCGSQGLAQLQDPIIVTGPAENGYLPVQWA